MGGALVTLPYVTGEREREQEGGRGTSNTPLCNRREKESRRVGGALVTLPYVTGERERELTALVVN